ncbi:similar to Saccharomyces cerevisiae YLR176C RFX1 Major transcriptional repressor of DNA-damage-regulated genes, recruits repressors Tup1p and Cyc8p to their promoters [Maudiozyma saulgeensis]|uniref:Similar to Saccharomyces cerevisiae YLR176C RFX1 Major transcriptional repressor of DNA-damage-regulated genes, recruits repressors Tup1p and Cyc8p to their promoters n=1 Tax=Maudiozyma saulgeensis TaxID=1789683 RepID=A0A1X7R983_9SACH|nr:similar to Saccharomyces cerevisiae YLR176C RFX1 Major transcriptional repressor of DNA-damage-regulated genes, recruits repressors Tup1p and Cyc8p to their promoters [Kazachstania saulgeensis]
MLSALQQQNFIKMEPTQTTIKDLGPSNNMGPSPTFQYGTQRTFSNGPIFNNNNNNNNNNGNSSNIEFQSSSSTSSSLVATNGSQFSSPQFNVSRKTSNNIQNNLLSTGKNGSTSSSISYNNISRPNVTNYISQPKITEQSFSVLSLPQPYRLSSHTEDNTTNSNNYYHYSTSPPSTTHTNNGNSDISIYPMGPTFHETTNIAQDRNFSNRYLPPQQQSIPQENKTAFIAQYGASQPFITRSSFPPLWMRAQTNDIPSTSTYNDFRKDEMNELNIKPKSHSIPSPQGYNSSTTLHSQYVIEHNTGILMRRNTQEQIAKAIAEKNIQVPIEEYASNVRKAELAVLEMNDNTHSKSAIQRAEQNREREKHVYALLWLMKNCKAETNSYVPRSRIFSQYAASCAKSTLKPLSQATLGKLIRTILPDITTRRLGMRGQSKYHYCNLVLLTENEASSRSSLNAEGILSDNSSIDTADSNVVTDSGNDSCNDSGVAELFNEIFKCNELSFDCSLQLPPIPLDEISSKIDSDIASSLESLYHVHCLSIYENVLFMKFGELPTCLNLSSNGSLSPQMFNLLISSKLYNWVYECDLKTHAVIIQELAKKIINEDTINENTLDKLKKFIQSYRDIVTSASLDLPIPMAENKVTVANKFCLILKELIKLLNYSNAFMENFPSYKNGMVHDWQMLVKHENFTDLALNINCYDGKKSDVDLKAAACTLKSKICYDISTFLESTETNKLQLRKLIEQFCKFITSKGGSTSHSIANYYLQFFGGLVGELSLKASENLRCWLYFNNIIYQLITYSADFRNLIDMVK